MTKQELLSKYRAYPTYTQIAKEAFEVGLKQGREENKTDKFKQMEKELKKTKDELKSLWKTLEDPEEFGRLIAGL